MISTCTLCTDYQITILHGCHLVISATHAVNIVYRHNALTHAVSHTSARNMDGSLYTCHACSVTILPHIHVMYMYQIGLLSHDFIGGK